MPLLVSVVIPTYRRRESLRRLLEALTRQNLAPECFEVIVSIDGSEDGTREMSEQFSASFSLQTLWQPNAGRAAACNRGIQAAAADLLVILDDDMEPIDSFLSAHLEAHHDFDKTQGHELCVLGAVPIRRDKNAPPVVRLMAGIHAAHVKKLSRPGYRIETRDFYTGNISIRREAMLRAGCFDADFKVYGNEDRELFMRLGSQGIQVVYSEKALAYQHYEKDFAALVRDRIAAGRTAVQLARKHPSAHDEFLMAKYRQSTRRWYCLRWMLLRGSRVWSGMPRFVVASVDTASRIAPSSFKYLAPAVLDYVYWESAFAEIRLGSLPIMLARPTDGGTHSFTSFEFSAVQPAGN